MPSVTKVSTQNSTPISQGQPSQKTAPKPLTGDSLTSRSSNSSKDSCLTKLWNAICNFFKCICPCLFGGKTQEDSSKNTTQQQNIQSGNTGLNELNVANSHSGSATATGPSKIEQVQTKLLTIWKESGIIDSVLVLELQRAAKASSFPQEKIILFYQHYNWGFRFFYAGISGKGDYLPIDWNLGWLLKTAMEKNIVLPWHITHPQTRKQVAVQVEKYEHLKPSSGSASTYECLDPLLNKAIKDPQSKEFHILQALIPYAHSFKEEMGDEKYAQLRALISAYPEHPVASS